MSLQNPCQQIPVYVRLFEHLRHACFVFRTVRLEHDGHERIHGDCFYPYPIRRFVAQRIVFTGGRKHCSRQVLTARRPTLSEQSQMLLGSRHLGVISY